MKNSQLDRLLRFAQRTGDRLIITDSEGKQPVVILSLDEYEALLDGRKQAPTRVESLRPMTAIEEEHVDMAEIEAAVEAANREFTEEPKVVPVKAVEEEAVQVRPQVEQRRPMVRRAATAEPTEEQFYMEPL